MSSKYLMNNILRETSQLALIKSLQDHPSHNQPNATLRHVQLSVCITDSRLDDELSVATIEFHNTPQWLSHDRSGFPKFTPLGTIWNGVDRSAIDEHGRTEFIRAVMKGGSNVEFLYVEMLAEFDTDVNVQDDRGRTALHWACALSHYDMVRLCLSVPDCNSGLLDHDGLTAFDLSRRGGSRDEAIPNLFYHNIMEMEEYAPQTALLRILTITSEPDTAMNLDKPVFPGDSMFLPVEDGNEPLVAALVARGIDFTATNENGDTALHIAAAKANLSIVGTLVNAGWDVNAIGNEGATPLHCATRTRDLQVVKLLLQHEANVGAKDDSGHTPLRLAEDIQCEGLVVLLQDVTDLTTSAIRAPKPVIDEISSWGYGDDDGPDQRGMTPLHHAARDGHTDTVTALLAHGVTIDAFNIAGNTPLHLAAMKGHTETVSALLAGGATIDASNIDGNTPLHSAAKNGHTETASALLAGRATIDASSAGRNTPLHLAAEHGHTETVSALLAGGATIDGSNIDGNTPLHLAAMNGHTETVSALLAGGATIDASSAGRNTPLHEAAENGQTEDFSALLSGGANINHLGSRGYIPLHYAARGGHTETVTTLLAGGASVDAPSAEGNTPLHVAARTGHTETLSALLACGANIDASNVYMNTPLHLAARNGHTETLSALLAGGARPDLENIIGSTALDDAVSNNEKDTTEILQVVALEMRRAARAQKTGRARLASVIRERFGL